VEALHVALVAEQRAMDVAVVTEVAATTSRAYTGPGWTSKCTAPAAAVASHWPKPRKVGFLAISQRFKEYEQAQGIALRLEALDLAFYQDFRTYMLDELSQARVSILSAGTSCASKRFRYVLS